MNGQLCVLFCDVVHRIPVSYTHLDVYKRQLVVIGSKLNETAIAQLFGC